VRIHHLNCGTLCPIGGRLVSGEGGMRGARIVCHCLLIEHGDSLVLVDTGMGAGDVANPYRSLGIPFTAAFRPQADAGETAVQRLRVLGLHPADVRHIVCTHLDLDHAGGLPDFADAEVHAFAAERDAAVDPSLRDRARYPSCHLDHGPKWAVHDVDGDTWHGFESVRLLPGDGPEILLIPLVGHSRGHTGVAIRDGDGWLLHCGDAYFHRGQMESPPRCPPGLRLFQAAMAADGSARTNNEQRLNELARDHGDEVRLFCAHDPVELERATAERERATAA
jgi:glyoxylase-like metal-dependent hydrolase (beta-lactamase superfamily II)